ncbi:hexosaminidase [Catalinimonas alkaloidigena]|uniref:beta-N-acetylhexosaminidase n=1 Tax=Catalinimonas alkaloidigena TaxID=1075417 RepID=A0A1G9R253_9BACT|nr:family 20 glycosylhydrolase [Catalinimonas alkaloidigena]SDM17329.1 hexosaminidase [Catalinimonas alkaloidigena]
MARTALLLLLTLFLGYSSLAQPSFDLQQLAVSWELTENQHQGKSQFQSAFTLRNTSQQNLPTTGWSLYFNLPRLIDSASVTKGFRIEHLNGDLFRLVSGPAFPGLPAGQSVEVTFVASDWSINRTDAPLGLYWVWDDASTQPQPVAHYEIIPSTQPKQFARTPDDRVDAMTSEMVFDQNQGIRDLPAEELPLIFPTPVSYQKKEGTFVLNRDVVLVADKAFAGEAAYWQGEMATLLGRPLPERAAATGKALVLQRREGAPEAYHLSVTPDRITLAAADGAGMFYGLQSLKSLLPPTAWKRSQRALAIPAVDVEDAPRFGFRAFLLDVGRHFQTKEQLLKTLDLMALYKLNVFHFHFSEDEGWRLEIPGLPELTDVGAHRSHPDGNDHLPPSYGSGPAATLYGSGYYTRTDFLEILRYAHTRHIRVIPEIESPGHARAAVQAMEARYRKLHAAGEEEAANRYRLADPNDTSRYRSVQLWNDNVMNVALPSTYRFLEKVIDEIQAMYREADVPLETIHLGGDEVPAGVWEGSPACQQLIATDPTVRHTNDLWYYYYGKVKALLESRGLYLYGWEEVALRKTKLDGQPIMIPNPDWAGEGVRVDVWNNVLGWGAEDLAYQLANAGYDVVLSPVSNLYFDMAYQKAFDEPGYYWGAFLDLDKPFSFIPYDYFKNVTTDKLGNPLSPTSFLGKTRLTDYGKEHIVGIQGLLWSETIQGPEAMEYRLLPKLLGMAERAWAPAPAWATEPDSARSAALYQDAWSEFVNVVGKRELPRLDHYAGGFHYRIPTPGARSIDGRVEANQQLPGLTLRYTTNGRTPTAKSPVYSGPIPAQGLIKLRLFTSTGRGGRTVTLGQRVENGTIRYR